MPGLVQALGHEPRRFEDYTALPVPSREACLRGVEAADAYVLLLGPSYGDLLPDTGKSPTEEEFTVAKRRGIPILAFRKSGVAQEPAQAEFAARVEDYRTGFFRASFSTTAVLLTAVAAGLREVASAKAPLDWRPLAAPVAVPWEALRLGGKQTLGTVLEVHVIPVASTALPATALADLADRLARTGREHRLFGQDRALDVGSDEDSARAIARTDGRLPFAGLRESRSRTLSVAVQLSSDMLGSLLDKSDISAKIDLALGIAADLNLATGDVAVAVALLGLQLLTEGSIADLGRRSSAALSGLAHNSESIRIDPADQIPCAALGTAREEVAAEYATRLILRFRQPRR